MNGQRVFNFQDAKVTILQLVTKQSILIFIGSMSNWNDAFNIGS